MLFNSLEFLFFFPCVVAIYFLLPNRFRWLHLLIASYYFYMTWNPAYALLLLISTVIFYAAALGVDFYQTSPSLRKIICIAGITLNLILLFIFKYYPFFQTQLSNMMSHLKMQCTLPVLDFLLPMGISFYTFQGISYLLDVYWQKMPAEKHLGILMLYKAFFPQLVAGPIERGTQFIPQLRTLLLPDSPQTVRFEYDRIVSGLRLMLLGFFKKIVLADNLALIVTPVYLFPRNYSEISILIATIAFSFQIFFDFSAYTDIARGTARILGFELMENFKTPYFATSISDFWNRWHISLSSWFRDYVYIPLGGNRVSSWRWMLNLWVVFLLCGIWHGANWTFIVWGILHGFYYFLHYLFTPLARWIVQHSFLKERPKLCQTLLRLLTFSAVSWAWVVFRANNLNDAIFMWKKIAHIPILLCSVFKQSVLFILPKMELNWLFDSTTSNYSLLALYLLIFTTGYLVITSRQTYDNNQISWTIFSKKTRWALYFFCLTCICILGKFSESPFIYFQF